MSLTKAELSQKFTSGELRVICSPHDNTPIDKMTHTKLLEVMKIGVNLTPKIFLHAVSFLLNRDKKYGYLMDGLGIYINPEDPTLNHYFGSSVHLINLDDGTYWCPTEDGLDRKNLTGWLGRQAFILETSLIVNFNQSMKQHDPRFWIVYDVVGEEEVLREGLQYQVTNQSLKEYYESVELTAMNISRTIPDLPRPRLVYDTVESIPSRVDTIPPPIGVKRKGTPLEADIAKRPRTE